MVLICCKLLPSKVAAATATSKAIRSFGCTQAAELPMKAGTVLKSLDIFKDDDVPVVKERHEYPEWVGTLAAPLPSIAVLRKIPNEEAKEKEILRYLKLTRRLKIKEQNDAASN